MSTALVATVSVRIRRNQGVLVYASELAEVEDLDALLDAACRGICGWIEVSADEAGNVVRA